MPKSFGDFLDIDIDCSRVQEWYIRSTQRKVKNRPTAISRRATEEKQMTNMRSFAKIAFLVTFTVVLSGPTVVHTQDIVNRYSTGGADGGFKDPLDGLNSLTEGPYPNSILSAVQATPPIVAGSAQGLGMLDKRQYYCNPGYGLCNGNFCCPTNELCFPPRGCCPRSLPYGCGQKYCCPYNSCLSNGQCGCNDGLYRCGNKCCKYGCNSSGNCACPSNYPVDCGDQTCCPSGYYCTVGDKCRAIGGGDTSPPPPSPPPPPPPPPVEPPRATSRVPSTPSPTTAPPPKEPPEIPEPDIPEPTIAPGGVGNSTASANRASKAVVVAMAVAVILVV